MLLSRQVVVADFEFEFGGHVSAEDAGRSGERPRPVCMMAKELHTGQAWRIWRGEFGPVPPFPTGPDALFVSYYASAELGCFRALGWPMPANVLDLFVEFRDRTNGLTTPAGSGLVGALAYFGIDHVGAAGKDATRALVLRGGPWSDEECALILRYCESDTLALEPLLAAMLPRIDLPRALLRGRYMKAAAAMEWTGVPIDAPTLALLRQNWEHIQDDLIAAIDADYGVFDGRTFKAERWAQYLASHGIPWPRSRTGRNQPSNAKFIFGPSVWLRSLIQPPPGHGIAYIDWSQQEFGIAAALSGDPAMQAAYHSGDPYLAFAKQAGAVPADATKATHAPTRELFKQCVLAVQYGMEAGSLAHRIAQPPVVARDLLRAHRETYRKFWRWSDAAIDHAMLTGSLHTAFGWHIHVGDDPNPRSLRNFPMQANGAEMLRLACCPATERGVEVCAPVHDAVLICAPIDHLEADITRMRAAMAEASRIVLGGFELRTDVMRVFHPHRFPDSRGTMMWDKVMDLLAKRQQTAVEMAA